MLTHKHIYANMWNIVCVCVYATVCMLCVRCMIYIHIQTHIRAYTKHMM